MTADLGETVVGAGAFLIPIVGSIALFSFLGVASWSEARRKEREAYYTADTLKKIAESSGEGAKAAMEYFQEKQRAQQRRRLEGMKLGGLITTGIGIGLMAFFRGIAHDAPIYLVGLMPLLCGLALAAYAFFLAPKE